MQERNSPVVTDDVNLPYSLEAEQAVLGSILIEPASINLVMDRLRAEHFYLPEHQAIYRDMCSKSVAGTMIDLVTVLESLKSMEYFSGESGKAYLLKLAQMVPSVSNLENYAGIVREKYDVRQLIMASRAIISDAMDPSVDASDLIDSAEQRIYDIRGDRHIGGLTPVSDVVASNYDMYNKLNSPERDKYVGLPSGFPKLDELTTGLNRSDMIVVGARPGMGKTAFALNVASHVAQTQKRPVAVFNLEMSKEQMVNRLISMEAKVSVKKLRTGNLTDEEWLRVGYASGKICEMPLYLDDTASITVPDIMARLRRLPDVCLVVIDYLGLMRSASKTENRVQEISEITRSLKILAKEMNVPLMVCAQLNRGGDGQAGGASKVKRPTLISLRDSGSIEQDADQVIFLHREDYYAANAGEGEGENKAPLQQNTVAEIIVEKNRHGETGTVKVAWSGEFTQFTNLEIFRNEG